MRASGLAMVTNQDGLGTASFPQADFDRAAALRASTHSAAQGIEFDAVCVCPHRQADGCNCRKPGSALVDGLPSRARRRSRGKRDDRRPRYGHRVRAQSRRARPARAAAWATPRSWHAIADELLARRATLERRHGKPAIRVSVDLDRPRADQQIATGIGFFDHMLEQLAKHGGFSLQLRCDGDLHVDEHHTVEDCALALGEALRQALGDKRGIARYGFLLPMDEARAQVAIDLSGRPYAVFEGEFGATEVGGSAHRTGAAFLPLAGRDAGRRDPRQVRGENTHHMVEACFKGVGRALRQALRREGNDLPSTKGVL